MSDWKQLMPNTDSQPTAVKKRRLPFNRKIFLLLAAVFVTSVSTLDAQDGASEAEDDECFIRFSGAATLTGDVYIFDSSPANANRPRRPANLWRLILTPTLTFGDVLTLPFNIMISSRDNGVTSTSGGGGDFLSFLRNPGNNLGFLSISPRLGWAQFHLGTHVPMYSELSSGDGQVFGAGVDLRPGKFRFSSSAGSLQRAIEPDSARGIRGSYGRWIYLTKIGYGTEQGSFIDLNIVRSRDDPASVRQMPEGAAPQEGTLLTANFRVGFSEQMSATGEAGLSYFTNDMSASRMADADPALDGIMLQRISSRLDYAGSFAFLFSENDWSVKASAKYIGAGYVALGYPYMQPDRLEFTLSPRVQLFENRLNINATAGNRTNNLSNTKAETSNQFIGSLNALGVITEDLTVSAGYSNFGIRNNTSMDTLRIETVAQSFNISPTWTIPSAAAVHTISATYSQDAYDDFNVVSGAANSNVTQSILGMYSASLTRIPISATLSYTYLTNDLKAGELTMNSFSLGGSYRIDNGRIVPSLNLTLSTNRLASYTSDRQVYLRASLRWQLSKMFAWTLAASRNDYRYGSSRPGNSFAETLFQTSLTTRF